MNYKYKNDVLLTIQQSRGHTYSPLSTTINQKTGRMYLFDSINLTDIDETSKIHRQNPHDLLESHLDSINSMEYHFEKTEQLHETDSELNLNLIKNIRDNIVEKIESLPTYERSPIPDSYESDGYVTQYLLEYNDPNELFSPFDESKLDEGSVEMNEMIEFVEKRNGEVDKLEIISFKIDRYSLSHVWIEDKKISGTNVNDSEKRISEIYDALANEI